MAGYRRKCPPEAETVGKEDGEYIKNGRWHICGASWDATDAIVPSTESAIRNIMLGQEFYRGGAVHAAP